ncbi:MAG TPA: hypothetical protein VF584_13990 [Longimicrobium sp.]|jgi:hypothetical protein
MLNFMSHDPTDGAGGGAFAPDNARQMIETASAFAQREMLPEARQALQRARSALSQRSDVGPAHWCNACLVALEIAARGGDVQGMEAEAAQLRSLSGGGQYWSEQARARIGKSSGRVDPARLDRVFAVLAGDAVPCFAPPPAAEPPALRVPDARPPAPEGTGRGLIAPTPRTAAPVEDHPVSAPPVEAPSSEVLAAPTSAAPGLPPREDAPASIAGATAPVPPEPTATAAIPDAQEAAASTTAASIPAASPVLPPAASPAAAPAERYAPVPSAPSLIEPRANEPAPGRVYPGAAWSGAAWMGSAEQDPPADRLPAESISTSAHRDDACFQAACHDEWMERLAEMADVADDDLPLIFVHDGTGPIDARLRVTPDRTDAKELLRSFVDHMTRWRDDVSDEEAENFYDLGTSFLEMEQWESAVKVFDQAMRNPGTRVAAAEGYLKALMGMGDHHAAFGAAGMALSNLADAGEPLSGILFLRGQAAEEIGDPREARRCYGEALRIDRFYADARGRLAALGE